MIKRYSTLLLLLCFWLFNAEAMKNDPMVPATDAKKVNVAMTPAADGVDHFSTLPTDLIPEIIIPYGEDHIKWGITAVVAEKYKEIALVNKRLKGVVNSIPFTRLMNRRGFLFDKGRGFYGNFFNLTSAAKMYHLINEDVMGGLVTLAHCQQEIDQSKDVGRRNSKMRTLKEELSLFKNKFYSLSTPKTREFFDAGYISYTLYGGKENMLTQAIGTNNPQLVNLLLAGRADPNTPLKGIYPHTPLRGIYPTGDRTPLFIACGEQFPRASNTSEALAICQSLLDAKASPNIAGCSNNALHHLIDTITLPNLYNPEFDGPAAQLVSRLVDARVDVNQISEGGNTVMRRLVGSTNYLKGYTNYTPYLKITTALVDGGLDMRRGVFFGETTANADHVCNYIALCPHSSAKINLLKKIQ